MDLTRYVVWAVVMLVVAVVIFAFPDVLGEGCARRAHNLSYEHRIGNTLQQLLISCALYEHEHGVYPYDPRGAEYALYNLYDIFSQAKEYLRERGVVPFRWNHKEEEVYGSIVWYLNPKLECKIKGDTVMFATKTRINTSGVYVISADATVARVNPRNESTENLVGVRLKDLVILSGG